MAQYDITKLPNRPTQANLDNLLNIYPIGQIGLLTIGAQILANLAAAGRNAILVQANFTRPSDTTAYASGDLVANSITAGSVVPMSFQVARNANQIATIKRVRLFSTSTVLTNASFRVHLYSTVPTASNGDNAAWLTTSSTYLGSFDVTLDKAFTDGSKGFAIPTVGTEIPVTADSDGTIFALLEARAAYTPTSAEVFTLVLEGSQS